MSIQLIQFLSRKTPLEEKIDTLTNSFERIIELFLEMAESFDSKVTNMDDKLNHLIINIKEMYSQINSVKDLNNNEKRSDMPLPPPDNPPKISQQKRLETSSNPRKDLIKELEEYFKKAKK